MFLSDFGRIVTGKTPSTKNGEFWDGTVPFVTPGDIQGTKHILGTSRYITAQGRDSVRGAVLPVNSICVSCIGNIGYVGVTTQESVSNQQINSIIVSSKHNVDYVYYLIRSLWPIFKNYEGQSTTLSILNKTQFSQIEVPEVSRDDEDKIAAVLSQLDAKIEVNNAINDNLEQQAYALYKVIVGNSEQSVPLSEYVSIKHGYAFKGEHISTVNNNIVLVTPGNFKIGGGFQENKCKYFMSDYPDEYVLHPGDLIVTMTDLSKDADTLGYGAIIPDNPGRIYLHNQRIGLVQFKKYSLCKDYIYWYLRSFDYHMRIVGSASGSTVKHTSPGRILEQCIPLPKDIDVMNLYTLQSIDKKIAKNVLENQKLMRIRDTLLPRLMSGEIDVSNIAV